MDLKKNENYFLSKPLPLGKLVSLAIGAPLKYELKEKQTTGSGKSLHEWFRYKFSVKSLPLDFYIVEEDLDTYIHGDIQEQVRTAK